MRPNECRRLLMFHTKTVLGSPGADYPDWKKRHVDAWNYPQKNSEIAVKQMLQGYASMADQFNDGHRGNEDEGGIGRDGYFGGHARNILRAVNAYLSMGGPTRFDNGAVHRLIRDLAEASGVNPDEI